MNDYKLEIKEQPKMDCGSTYVECRVIKRRDDGSISVELCLGSMYFVANKKKQVTQCYSWLWDYKDQLKELGYKLKGKKQ
jgi:hypothetical protein